MSNRSPRHLRPGQRNLRGKKTMSVCPCCDPVIDHRDKIRAALDRLAMDQEPLGTDFERVWDENTDKLYET